MGFCGWSGGAVGDGDAKDGGIGEDTVAPGSGFEVGERIGGGLIVVCGR